MRKLIFLFIFLFILSGCTNEEVVLTDDELEEEIHRLTDLITGYEKELDELKERQLTYKEKISSVKMLREDNSKFYYGGSEDSFSIIWDQFEEVQFSLRDDIEIVENEERCEEQDVYCFLYKSSYLVELKMDETQKGFYQLMLDYKLPDGGKVYDDGAMEEIVIYENGYEFGKDSKIFYRAPGYSMDTVKPTKDQYFGIVMLWVQLFGSNTLDYFFNPDSKLESLNKLKEFAEDKIVIDWINECEAILQEIIDADDPGSSLYIEAWKKLNYLGNVVDAYRYELELYKNRG